MPRNSNAGRPEVVSRRGVLGVSAGIAAATVLPRQSGGGGFFSGVSQSIRVGVIGCGGRGTGAAIQAAAASPDVRVVALADLYADQIASSASLLSRGLGHRFDCPEERRFIGPHCHAGLLASGVDVVLLTAPPHVRPLQMAAAIAAGAHVYCEKPVAVDLPGVQTVIAACQAARRSGLAVVSGLCHRRDGRTVQTIERIRDGWIGCHGEPLLLQAHARIGLPWWRPCDPCRGEDEIRQRNWISFSEFSGGHFVERHVDAIDRGLWALGDISPVAAVPEPAGFEATHRSDRAGLPGDCAAFTGVRYSFADGSLLHASCTRAPSVGSRLVETVSGSRGACDLLRHRFAPAGRPLADADTGLPRSGGIYQTTMTALIDAVGSGRTMDDGGFMCRSTLAAIAGRMAAASGREIRWDGILSPVRQDCPFHTLPDFVNGA